MKICVQGNFRAENSNMDVPFTYLEYATLDMTSPNHYKVGPFLPVFESGGVMPGSKTGTPAFFIKNLIPFLNSLVFFA